MSDKIKILQKWFVDREGQSIVKELHKINLLESGILDSLDILTLVMFLEKKFKIKIDISKPKILKSFEKFDTIVKLLDK
jgi:acyl carrier protein